MFFAEHRYSRFHSEAKFACEWECSENVDSGRFRTNLAPTFNHAECARPFLERHRHRVYWNFTLNFGEFIALHIFR